MSYGANWTSVARAAAPLVKKILEGEKERTQVFSGLVISRKGEGMRAMFTVRRIVQSEGVERTFPLNSPKIVRR